MADEALVKDLLALFNNATSRGYVMLPDDYTALGYAVSGVNDYRHVKFVIGQANDALNFVNMYEHVLYYKLGQDDYGYYVMR